MDLIDLVQFGLFIIGVWYAFRSGMLAERKRWQDKTREGSDY